MWEHQRDSFPIEPAHGNRSREKLPFSRHKPWKRYQPVPGERDRERKFEICSSKLPQFAFQLVDLLPGETWCLDLMTNEWLFLGSFKPCWEQGPQHLLPRDGTEDRCFSYVHNWVLSHSVIYFIFDKLSKYHVRCLIVPTISAPE